MTEAERKLDKLEASLKHTIGALQDIDKYASERRHMVELNVIRLKAMTALAEVKAIMAGHRAP